MRRVPPAAILAVTVASCGSLSTTPDAGVAEEDSSLARPTRSATSTPTRIVDVTGDGAPDVLEALGSGIMLSAAQP